LLAILRTWASDTRRFIELVLILPLLLGLYGKVRVRGALGS